MNAPAHNVTHLTEAQAAKIEAAVAQWPPLTPEQRDTLAAIFDCKTPQPISERNAQ